MRSGNKHNGNGSSAHTWVGVGRSSSTIAAQAGREAATAAIAGRDPKLLIVFCSHAYELQKLLDAISEVSGDAPLISCSTVGEIAGGGVQDSSVVVSALGGDGYSVRTTAATSASSDLRRSGTEAAASVTELDESSMHAALVGNLKLQDDLVRALERGEIETHFQPKVDLRTAKVVGVEALVRWTHPERGLVRPAELLVVAEAGGHMRALTERVIKYATRAAGDWWHSGLGLQLSVNLSPSTFSEPGWQIDEFVARTLSQTGLPGTALQFEITEDALMGSTEAAAATLERLSDLGAGISIDDFGTGYSSLRRLKTLPIDELKIDRSFVLNLVEDEGDMAIVRSTIHLAHQMGLQVVAEGVETHEAWRQLRKMGCERAQGFLVAKPLPAREVPAWLAEWSQRSREFRGPSRARRGPAKPRPIGRPAPATA
jgi:EAL domain-containing protein (putative c-di-GMP-specific phosphodiesterase class I)